jgi:hypothetical protein
VCGAKGFFRRPARLPKLKNSKFFDRSEKSDVYYEAQLIAAKSGKAGKACVAGFIKNIQPISVGV